MDRQLILSAVLIVHLGAALLHGYSHAIVPVNLSMMLNAIVLLTVFVGPTVGVILARRNHPYGTPVFTVSMIGAVLVGGMFHFVVENPDHASRLPASPAGHVFEVSALAVLITPIIGAVYGMMRWQSTRI